MDEDPVEQSGCAAENDALFLCYDATKDWRACRKELEAFKQCMKSVSAIERNNETKHKQK